MPFFSHFYGLHPWDVERMTLREISEYQAWADRYQAEQERANKI